MHLATDRLGLLSNAPTCPRRALFHYLSAVLLLPSSAKVACQQLQCFSVRCTSACRRTKIGRWLAQVQGRLNSWRLFWDSFILSLFLRRRRQKISAYLRLKFMLRATFCEFVDGCRRPLSPSAQALISTADGLFWLGLIRRKTSPTYAAKRHSASAVQVGVTANT